MRSTGTRSASTHRELVSSPSPTYISVSATYSGLRDRRNGPVVTSAVVGSIGLTLVPARSITERPQAASVTPSAARSPPNQYRPSEERMDQGTTQLSSKPAASAKT